MKLTLHYEKICKKSWVKLQDTVPLLSIYLVKL